jgi:hypothetical protein
MPLLTRIADPPPGTLQDEDFEIVGWIGEGQAGIVSLA